VIKVDYSCAVATKKALPRGGPDVLTIKETAKILGVSEVTLRRWDKSGKFSPHRHPVNGYRCYRRDDVLRMRRRIETGKAA
jgi:DNA-binding transcriptional MerR regulator